jgi:hypothetical protein
VQAWQLVQGRSFCQFALYAAMAGGRDVQADVAAEWAQLASARGAPSAAPTAQPQAASNGWTAWAAEQEEHTASTGRYRVRQVVYSGHGLRMSALVLGNDPALCHARGQAFLAGLVPLTPAPPTTTVPAQPAAQAADPRQAPGLSAQTWMKTAASYSHCGTHYNVGEMAKLSAGQGYVRRSWQFGADGRYRYRVEIWSMTYQPEALSGIEEVGRWRLQGDRITVEPERAVSYAEDKSTRRRLHEKPTQAERTEYAVRLHWLSGMGAWYLVLAPVNGRQTGREGDFDQQPGFPKAYFYGPPPKVDG